MIDRNDLQRRGITSQMVSRIPAEAVDAWPVKRQRDDAVFVVAASGLFLITERMDEHWAWDRLTELASPSPTDVELVGADGSTTRLRFSTAGQYSEFERLVRAGDYVVGSPPDGPRSKRARSYRMVDALAEAGRKYRLALSGERFASFSVLGTEDWEDYASLSLDAMSLESALDLDARVEQLSDRVAEISAQIEHMDSHLERIVELLEQSAASAGCNGR